MATGKSQSDEVENGAPEPPPGVKLLHTLEGHTASVWGVAFDPKGGTLASGGNDNTVKLWDATSGKLLRTLEGHTDVVQAIGFGAQGQLLVSKGKDGLKLWNTETWTVLAEIPEAGPSIWFHPLVVHPVISLVASLFDQRELIHLWELDLDVLLGKAPGARPTTQTAHHTTAKVVLVGDTGVGKSAMAERLVHGKFVLTESTHARRALLLDPTRVDAYASALLVAAKDEPDGPGHLLESRVSKGKFKLVESERLGDKDFEKHVLWYVMESLFERDLALRETIEDEEYIVFPAQCTSELKFPGAASFGVAFGVAGPVRSIYATLIAQLAHYEGFPKRAFFQDAAAYHTKTGKRCLVRLHDEGDGTGEFEVSFDDPMPPDIRLGFLKFIEDHLASHAVPESLTKRYAYHCQECSKPFDDAVVKERLEQRRTYLLCPYCEKPTPLLDLLATPTAAGAKVADKMEFDARAVRKRITAAWVIKGKKAQGTYDVFLSHNSKDKAAVEKIARKLLKIGIRPWLDEWDLIAGDTILDALEMAIESIHCGALFFGPADMGTWHVMEIRAYVEAWANETGRLIPVILPGVEDMPKLPIWIRQAHRVDMRNWMQKGDDSFNRLAYGILGKQPGDASRASLRTKEVWEWQQALE